MAKKTKEKIIHSTVDGVVVTPAGYPPCNPSHMPDPTDEDVIDWAYEIVELGNAKGLQYGVEAVQYFARRFWDLHTPRYKEVAFLIRESLNPSEDIM